ncbi:MAG TPA: hypothetical protein VHE35_33390 [Kofleriaceae bacterium]|nr:hypothetical protein [Kofleriaceae bacterium]
MLRKLGLGLLCSVLIAGCGEAVLISQNQAGGVFRINGDRNKGMEDANKQMAAHCGPGNYTITQQGEEAIGTDVITQSNTNYGEDTVAGGASQTNNNGYGSSSSQAVGASSTRGGSSTNGIQSTRTATEWRVHYVCGAPGMNPGGPPPPPPPPPAP